MSLSIRYIKPKDFGEDKMVNTAKLYDVMLKNYQNRGDTNAEIAKVFYCSDSSGIYEVSGYEIAFASDDAAVAIDASDAIDTLCNYHESNPHFRFTVFHNHRHHTSFSLLDVWQMFRYEKIKEIYIDSGFDVCVLIKGLDSASGDDVADAILQRLEAIERDVAIEFVDEYLAAEKHNRDYGNKDKLNDVNEKIYEVVLKRAFEENVFSITRGKFNKNDLNSYL